MTFPRGAVGCSVLCDCSSSDHTHIFYRMVVAISTFSIKKLNGFSPLYFLKAQHFQSVYRLLPAIVSYGFGLDIRYIVIEWRLGPLLRINSFGTGSEVFL